MGAVASTPDAFLGEARENKARMRISYVDFRSWAHCITRGRLCGGYLAQQEKKSRSSARIERAKTMTEKSGASTDTCRTPCSHNAQQNSSSLRLSVAEWVALTIPDMIYLILDSSLPIGMLVVLVRGLTNGFEKGKELPT